MQQGEIRRAGAAVWRELVERQRGGGLSVLESCRREGVNAWSFYRWRLRLRAGGGEVKRAPRTEVVRREPLPADGAFIDLGALPAMSRGWEVYLDVGGGVVLHLARR